MQCSLENASCGDGDIPEGISLCVLWGRPHLQVVASERLGDPAPYQITTGSWIWWQALSLHLPKIYGGFGDCLVPTHWHSSWAGVREETGAFRQDCGTTQFQAKNVAALGLQSFSWTWVSFVFGLQSSLPGVRRLSYCFCQIRKKMGHL